LKKKFAILEKIQKEKEEKFEKTSFPAENVSSPISAFQNQPHSNGSNGYHVEGNGTKSHEIENGKSEKSNFLEDTNVDTEESNVESSRTTPIDYQRYDDDQTILSENELQKIFKETSHFSVTMVLQENTTEIVDEQDEIEFYEEFFLMTI